MGSTIFAEGASKAQKPHSSCTFAAAALQYQQAVVGAEVVEFALDEMEDSGFQVAGAFVSSYFSSPAEAGPLKVERGVSWGG